MIEVKADREMREILKSFEYSDRIERLDRELEMIEAFRSAVREEIESYACPECEKRMSEFPDRLICWDCGHEELLDDEE